MATNRDGDSMPDPDGEVLRKQVAAYLSKALGKAKALIMEKSDLDCDYELMAAFRVRAALLTAYAAIEDMPQYDDLDEARDSHGDEGKA